MIESFERKGVWWLPGQPERRVYGTLKFDPVEGVTLDLFGSFRRQEQSFGFQERIILGEYPDGRPVTLFQCNEKNIILSVYTLTRAEGFLETALSVGYVFDEQHFETEEDIKFEKLNLSLSHLRHWARGIKFKISTSTEISVTSETPPDIEVDLNGIGKLKLHYSPRFKSSFSETIVKELVYLNIQANEPLSFPKWWKVTYLLRVFFSFATRHAVHPLSMEEIEEVKVECPNGKIRDSYRHTKIFFCLGELPDDSSTEGGRGMLFTLSDLQGDFGRCLQNWFDKSELLEPIYDLYFGTLQSPRMYPIHKFSSLIQALESYHRRTNNRTAVPKQEHKRRLEKILSTTPESYRDWLKGKLNFSNEVSLHQRLEDIFATYTAIFGPYEHQDIFIKRAKDTRNYLTHYDAKSKHKAARHEELYHLSQSIRMLLEMCLLKELELENDVIRNIIQRDREQHWFHLYPPAKSNGHPA